jgi:hypothetical protein
LFRIALLQPHIPETRKSIAFSISGECALDDATRSAMFLREIAAISAVAIT